MKRLDTWAPADGWTPRPGALYMAPSGRVWEIFCACCKQHRKAPNRSKAVDVLNAHRCPAGTVTAYPPCPVCSSRTAKCWRTEADGLREDHLNAGPIDTWHQERLDVWHERVGDLP